VPLIAYWPGQVPAGTTSDFIGAFWDVLPTLAELAGGKMPKGLDGISFVPALRGQKEKQRAHDALYWAFYERGGAQAVRMGRWKAVQQPIRAPIQLYDLDQDLSEQRDVADKHPDVVAKMKQVMEASYLPSARWKFPEPGPKKPAGK
jgi:arylsulfatase A-like enzyme